MHSGPIDQDHAVILEMGKATLELFDEPHAAAVDKIEVGRRVSGPIRFALQVPDLRAAPGFRLVTLAWIGSDQSADSTGVGTSA